MVKHFLAGASHIHRPARAFILDFGICLGAALLTNLYFLLVLGLPIYSLLSLFIGCFIAGFFIGLDSSLATERKGILEAMEENQEIPIPTRFFSLSRKYALVAVITTVLVGIVLVLVFVRDVEWLTETSKDPDAIMDAKLSVIYEILFIIGALLILVTNLIVSYSRNLKLLFKNQTNVLEQVQRGDLSRKVAVATRDEFGVIAGHTNHMIDGLRHRFELMSALRLAEEVQQNLLPVKSPYLKGYDISGFSLYCDQTGGDYYDYFLLPDEKFGVAVADVCGHGVGAAMLMTSVRAYMVSAIQTYTNPADLLATVNKNLTKDCAISGVFTTMFFLEIDQASKVIRWVRAGHEPAVYYRRETGQFTELGGKGLVLGVDADFRFENQVEQNLSEGDIVVIGTDGIHETMNRQNLLFGKKRLRELIEHNSSRSAREIQQEVVLEVERFRDGLPQEDDITLVVIKIG
nr:PP2C family protein-serine/threonine phosphatase [Desulfosediminicola ganghwensis]